MCVFYFFFFFYILYNIWLFFPFPFFFLNVIASLSKNPFKVPGNLSPCDFECPCLSLEWSCCLYVWGILWEGGTSSSCCCDPRHKFSLWFTCVVSSSLQNVLIVHDASLSHWLHSLRWINWVNMIGDQQLVDVWLFMIMWGLEDPVTPQQDFWICVQI